MKEKDYARKCWECGYIKYISGDNLNGQCSRDSKKNHGVSLDNTNCLPFYETPGGRISNEEILLHEGDADFDAHLDETSKRVNTKFPKWKRDLGRWLMQPFRCEFEF